MEGEGLEGAPRRPLLKHYVELRYEDLVLDPEGSLRKISEFVDLPYDDAMLRYHEKAERRLQEMARELPEQSGKTRLSIERRMATHARTTEPPDPERVTRWRKEMSAPTARRLSPSPGTCSPSWALGEDGAADGAVGVPPNLGELGTPRPGESVRRIALRAREIRARRASTAAWRPAIPPAPFIVGATRSGTTLLRLMLDAHPRWRSPPRRTSSPT